MEPVIELASAFLAQVDRGKTQDTFGPSYYDDPRAIAIACIIETDLGVRSVQVLGGGSFGVAAATAEHGGDVIKLTTDVSEVESGTVLTNTARDTYPRNVVHVQGAWYLRKLTVISESWFDPRSHEYHYSKHRIGLLRMERVHGLDAYEHAYEMQGLADYAAFVKQANKVWAYQTRHLSRAAARERFLRAGTQLEDMLMQVWQDQHQQVARDIARAIGQLRVLGIYGTDFHGGNVGWVPDLSKHVAREGLIEETLEYRGVKFELVSHEGTFRVRVPLLRGDSTSLGPFDTREQAIAAAHAKIDEQQPASDPAPRIYKVFDIGMSSAGAHAPKPAEMPPQRAGKALGEAYSPPILDHSVKVAELG